MRAPGNKVGVQLVGAQRKNGRLKKSERKSAGEKARKLPLAILFFSFSFSLANFRTAPQLTEQMEEITSEVFAQLLLGKAHARNIIFTNSLRWFIYHEISYKFIYYIS